MAVAASEAQPPPPPVPDHDLADACVRVRARRAGRARHMLSHKWMGCNFTVTDRGTDKFSLEVKCPFHGGKKLKEIACTRTRTVNLKADEALEDALAPAIQRGRVWLARALGCKDRGEHMKLRDADVYEGEGDMEHQVQFAWDLLVSSGAPAGHPGPGSPAAGPEGSSGSSSSSSSSGSSSDSDSD